MSERILNTNYPSRIPGQDPTFGRIVEDLLGTQKIRWMDAKELNEATIAFTSRCERADLGGKSGR